MKLAVYAALAVLAVALITYGLSRLKPAAPSVERGTVVTDTVKRGQMLLQVRGIGTLVPEEVRQIAAPVEGRVEQIFVKAGTEVSAGTVLVELSNPTVRQQAVDVEYQVKSAEADLNNLRARLESDRMAQQAATAQIESEYNQAKIQLDTDEQLGKEGLVPLLTLRISRVRVQQLANRLEIEKKRLTTARQSADAQVAAQQSHIEQLRAQLRLNQEQVASLQVRAGTNGVLQEVTVTVGQQITPGTNIARVADPTSLKAALQVPETQIKDVAIGQTASVDTRSGNGGVVGGRVSRIDPAAHSGTFTVDVQLEGPMPPGARVDLSVDGTIELARLDNVLYVGRPSSGGAQSSVSLFRVEPDGHTAVRVPVKLGRASVSTVEILDGLREGDTVILSDTQQWDGVDRLRID